MSSKITESVKTDARAAKLWGADLSPSEVKAYAQVKKVDSAADAASWKLRRDVIVTVGALTALGVVLAVALWLLVASDDERKVQTGGTLATAILSGFFSYLAGSKIGQ